MNCGLRPKVNFIDEDTIKHVLERAYDLLGKVGVKIENDEAIKILGENGANVSIGSKLVRIPPFLIDKALKTVPSSIQLYNDIGEKSVTIGGNNIAFVPGGSAPFLIDNDTGKIKEPVTGDAIKFYRLVETLENIPLNHTALVLSDVPEGFRDSYRYFLALLNTSKPISGGMFTIEAMRVVKEMLIVAAGSETEMREKPRITVSCCPTSPLCWDNVATQNLIDCARYKIPARVVPAAIAGGTSPITLLGTIMQQVAENLSGVVIHQLTAPNSPVYCGTGAAVMDMRSGLSLFGAAESQMMKVALAQIFDYLSIPSYAIMAFSESKTIDAQAGLESSNGILLGALGCINLIGGLGMLNTGMCQSLEKIIIDNEICGIANRITRGIACTESHMAFEEIEKVGAGGNFLMLNHTLEWLKSEHYFPSEVINREPLAKFEAEGRKDTYMTATQRAKRILNSCHSRQFAEDKKQELVRIITAEGHRHGLEKLPKYE